MSILSALVVKRKPPVPANWPILANFPLSLVDFLPILAKETLEFFDEIKAGELSAPNHKSHRKSLAI